MIIEIILIILGLLTFALGIWNIIIGAYVWGVIFLLGGLWSLWLGIVYIIQLRKLQKDEPQEDTKVLLTKVIDEDNQFVLDKNLEKSFSKMMEETLSKEDKKAQEAKKFDEAINFTNEVIPNPSVESSRLDEYEENAQIPTDIDEIDRNIEVIQEIVDKKETPKEESKVIDNKEKTVIELTQEETQEETTTNELIVLENQDSSLMEIPTGEMDLIKVSSD